MAAPLTFTSKREAYEAIAERHRAIEAARNAYSAAIEPAQDVFKKAVKPHSDIYAGVRRQMQEEVNDIASRFDITYTSSFDLTADDVQRSDEESWEASESWSSSSC